MNARDGRVTLLTSPISVSGLEKRKDGVMRFWTMAYNIME
jgi:hypothetical protein